MRGLLLAVVLIFAVSCDRSQFGRIQKSSTDGNVDTSETRGLSCNSDKCYGATTDGGIVNGGTSCAGNCSDNQGNYCFGFDCQGAADADTLCVGKGCTSQSSGTACLGRDCEGVGRTLGQFCYGLNCTPADGPLNGAEGTYCYGDSCKGLQGSSTMCQGPKCSDANSNITYCFGKTCSGTNGDNTTCYGYDCQGYDGKRTICVGTGCSEGTDKGAKVVEKTYSYVVPKSSKQLDVLLVVDDSSSMLADNQKMAARLEPFVSDLKSAGIDWQMCATLTNPEPDNTDLSLPVCTTSTQNNCLKFYWGNSVCWVDGRDTCATSTDWILKADSLNLTQTFKDTITNIGAGWAYTDDERAIKASIAHIKNRSKNSCYRDGAALAIIALSDEDERSVGGRSTAESATELNADYDTGGSAIALTTEDQPETLVSLVKSEFGDSKVFSFHSVIVKPGDTECKATQDAEGSLSHYGSIYKKLSESTSGIVASICAEDYGPTLRAVRNIIKNSVNSVELACAPVASPNVTVTPTVDNLQFTSSGKLINFNPALPEGTEVSVSYTCLYSRGVASASDQVKVLTSEELSALAAKQQREPASPQSHSVPIWVYIVMVVALASLVFYTYIELFKKGGER